MKADMVGWPVIASSHRPSADPLWKKPAFTVMAGLVPTISSAHSATTDGRDKPGHNGESDTRRTGFLVRGAATLGSSPWACAAISIAVRNGIGASLRSQ